LDESYRARGEEAIASLREANNLAKEARASAVDELGTPSEQVRQQAQMAAGQSAIA
jgi:hypothetical protein